MRLLVYYQQQGYGGVDTHLAHLVNYWPNDEDEIYIVSNADNQGLVFLKGNVNNPNVSIHTIDAVFQDIPQGATKFTKVFLRLRSYIRFNKKFVILLRELSPDVVLSNNGGYPGGFTNWSSAIIAKFFIKSSGNIFLLVHHSPVERVKGLYQAIIAGFARIVQYFNIPVITVSQASKNMLQKFTPLKDINVIYNGLSYNDPPIKKYDFSNYDSVLPGRIIVGMIGPIDSHKGHISIIKAFNQSSILRDKAHFVIVGRGDNDLVNELMSTIQDYNLSGYITMTGFLPVDSLSIVSGFDILAMPTTDFEGFGYSMAEAMLCGVPVVASKVGAIPEIIINEKSGYLVNPNNIELGWKPVLENLVKDENLRMEIGLSGKRRIEEEFTADRMAKQYYNLLTRN
jgi:L-malate glycosyltransferase